MLYTGSDIGGLCSGCVYFVIASAGDLGGHEIWLDTDHGDATSGGTHFSDFSNIVSLSPNKSSGALSTLVRNDNAPIGGLNDGQTYYVDQRQPATSSCPRHSGRRRDRHRQGGRTGGPQNFAVEGVDFTSGGNGKLVFDITGTSSGTQQFLGIGGNVPAGAPVGDGIVTGTASGGGGGLIAVNNGSASSSEGVTVKTEVQGGGTTISGANVNVTSHGFANTKASVVVNSGGLVSVDSAASSTSVTINNSTAIDGGATITATGNVDIDASAQISENVAASSNSGGFIGSASGADIGHLDYVNTTTVGGSITAGNAATVEAHANVNGVAQASGDTGGAIAGGGAHAHVEIGDTNAFNQVHIVGGAQIKSANLTLLAQVDAMKANAKGNSHTGAAFGGSTGEGDVNASGTTEVRLESGSFVEGDATATITAEYAASNIYAEGDGSCSCLGGDTNGNVNEYVNVNALVSGLAGAQLKVGQLNVNALQFDPGFGYSASQDGGWFDIGGVSVNGSAGFQRNIYWEATTYLQGSPDPLLVVDSTGKIVALQNVTVTDQHGNPKGLGDTFGPGDIIEVGDLVKHTKIYE